MDDATQKIFKIKFTKLVILLNVDVLLFTCGIFSIFFLPYQFRLYAALISFLLALVLGMHILRSYRETKRWLEKQTSTD
ncbi:MAG: hypothetical protein LUO82_03950 [Methanomicrobiales archaeon]|nr:hypothetical protein [Methanomicrobiales archaeon]